MIIKNVKSKKDLDNIEELNKLQDFKLKDINHCIVDRIIYDGTEVIAYGIVKRMAEAILLVNPKISLITRAKAMRELMKIAEAYSAKEDCQQLHCFVKDEKLARSLEKQFGFKLTSDLVLSKDL